jgi:hypothetical protein
MIASFNLVDRQNDIIFQEFRIHHHGLSDMSLYPAACFPRFPVSLLVGRDFQGSDAFDGKDPSLDLSHVILVKTWCFGIVQTLRFCVTTCQPFDRWTLFVVSNQNDHVVSKIKVSVVTLSPYFSRYRKAVHL